MLYIYSKSDQAWGLNLYSRDHNTFIYDFGRGLPALHNHVFSFYYKWAVLENSFENWLPFGSFNPIPGATGDRDPEIHNLPLPCPKMLYTKFEKIGLIVFNKRLRMFHCFKMHN
jgi:hypothetical protein